MVHAYFEREDTDIPVDLTQIYERMERHESDLSRPPPEGIDQEAMISKLKVESQRSNFSREDNLAVEMLLGADKERAQAFINLM